MKLSIIIPAYNEEKTIAKIIKRIKKVRLTVTKEVIIVNDCSTDRTKNIIDKISWKGVVKAVHKEKNEGKGSAVIRGLKESTGDILLIQDADLEYNPADYPRLIKPILNNETKVVYGTRIYSKKGNLKKNTFAYWSHVFGNKLLTRITNLLYGSKLTDMETGYKVFTREVYEKLNLKSKGFELEPEITSKILKKGFNICEVPIDYCSRSFEEGKKINWKDGVKAVCQLIIYKFKR